MKRMLATLLAAAMLVSMSACSSGGTAESSAPAGEPASSEDAAAPEETPEEDDAAPAADGETIKIGGLAPLTGDVSQYGTAVDNAVKLAVADINAAGGVLGKQVEYICYDEKGDANEAVNAYNKLVNDDGVVALVGDVTSKPTEAVAQRALDDNLPMITASGTAEGITQGRPNVFRACFIDPFQGTVLANYAFDQLGARKAYMLGEAGNDYDAGLMNYFQEAFEALGGTVVSDNFQTNNSDFTSYLNKAVSEQAEVVFIPVSITYSTQIIAQAKSMDLTIPILGSDTLDNNTVLAAAADSNLDLIVTTFYNEGGNAEFDEGFKEWINSDSVNLDNNGGNDMIAAVSVMGFDAYNVALEAIKLAGSTDPVAIKDALWDVNYDGITGNITFGENGDAVRDTAYIKISDNVAVAWTDGGTQTVA